MANDYVFSGNKEKLLSEVNAVLDMCEDTENYTDGEVVDFMYPVLLSVRDYLKEN